jgi:hypothetical protein
MPHEVQGDHDNKLEVIGTVPPMMNLNKSMSSLSFMAKVDQVTSL